MKRRSLSIILSDPRYRCLAINNNLTEAAEASLKINMLCEYRDN